jgi:hypothetical protein
MAVLFVCAGISLQRLSILRDRGVLFHYFIIPTAVTLLTCIREVPSSNLGLGTDYAD